MFPDGHGTAITVRVPEDYVNNDGETEKIPLYGGTYGYPVLTESPLFEDIDVFFNGMRVPIGAAFPIDSYDRIFQAKFDWGVANIYVGREENERDKYGSNVRYLSNGLWQFSQPLKQGPNYDDPNILRSFYIDLSPKVETEDSRYPIDLNRQRFSKRAENDIDVILRYLTTLYRNEELVKQSSEFGSLEVLRRKENGDVYVSKTIDISPPLTEETITGKINPSDKVEIVDGVMTANGKVVPVLTRDMMKETKVDIANFNVDQSTIPSYDPLVHDNLEVEVRAGEWMPFTKWAREMYGPEFDKMNYEIGKLFIQLRYAASQVMPELEGMDAIATGVAYDQKYRGVSLNGAPFKGMFVNPLATRYEDPVRAASGIKGTMIHEMAHYRQRNHSGEFASEMQDILINLESAFPLDVFTNRLREVFAEHNDLLTKLRAVFNNEDRVRPTGKSFEGQSNESIDDATNRNRSKDRQGQTGSRGDAGGLGGLGERTGGRRGVRGDSGKSTGPSQQKPLAGALPSNVSLNEQAARFPGLANKVVGPNGLADKGLRKIPEAVMTPAIRTDMWAALEKLTMPLRSLFYKALNASQMGEVASKYFGRDSVRFATILNEIGGYRQRIEERLEPLNRQFVAHQEKFPERHAALHALMNDATIADVAPYDDAATAKKYTGTPKEATYEALKKRFNELTAEEKQMYKSGFDSFVTLREEFKKALKGNISELVKDEATALSIYNKIMNELSEIMIDHYFPLYRKGDFRLSYTLNGTGVVERFETQAERTAKQRELEAQGATDIEATSQLDQFNSSNIPNGSMLSAVMKIVKDAGGTKEDLDKVVQLVVSAFPETSILKRQQKRTGIPGYVNDNAALVFDSVTSNNARQIATIKYREELKSLMDKMRETQAGLRGDASEDARTMLEDIDARFRFAMDPDVAGWAQTASSTAFYWNLAANVSSALVQFATLPTVVFPNLGGRYGSGKAWEAIKSAQKLYQSSGFTRQVEGLDGRVTEEKAMLSIENLINQGDPKAAKYAGLIEAMKDNELLTASTAHNALRAENRTDSGYGAVNKLQRVTALYSSFLMHHTERMSREVTAVAAYDLELARLEKRRPGMKEAERQAAAIREAIRVVERTHGAVTSITGTRIGQNSIGKIFMVFKNYAFAQYYNLFSTIFRAFPVKDADPDTLEDIKAARRQLVGMYGMVAMFAGVKGVPLYWVAELAYNALTDDDEEDFDMVMRRYLGEFLFKGPVNYITNLSIADRVGWTDLIWRENKNDRVGTSAVVQYLESSFAPLSIIKNFEKGAKIISDTGSWYRGIETMLPAAIKNPMKALRYGSEGANTLRGDPVMADINIGNAAMQVLGFAPADLMTQYEQNAEILARQKAIRGGEQKLLKQYYVALKNNDFERASEAAEKLYELGEKYPELGIGPALLNKSVKERERFSSKLYHGMRVDDKLRERLLGASQIEYD
jgi:hypothetical protein